MIGHGRPYHFIYDGMLGFEIIYEHVKEIDNQTKFYTLENNAFINAPKIFNSNQTAEFITNKTLTQLEIEGTLFIKIGALFGNGAKDPVIMNRINNLDKKVLSYISNIHTDKENSTNELKKHFPIIWLGVTGQKRAWLEQVEGYSNIINKLYETFPGMAVVFDGWTSSLVTLQRDKVETANDRSIIDDIKNRIAPDIRTVDLVGATIDRKIHIGSVVDCAIVNYSTGSMNISRICGRPCITHMNNSFSPARNQHIHQNAHHIPDEYVTDVMDNDSRIDATSYHIDWENIYSAMTLHLGKITLFRRDGSMKRTVAFVPLKLNNERLPNKNTKQLSDGTPLLSLILNTLKQIENVDDVYVYCSDESVIKYLPKGVKFLQRSTELDLSTTKINEVLGSFARDIKADIYVLAHATAPFLKKRAFRTVLIKFSLVIMIPL